MTRCVSLHQIFRTLNKAYTTASLNNFSTTLYPAINRQYGTYAYMPASDSCIQLLRHPQLAFWAKRYHMVAHNIHNETKQIAGLLFISH